MLQQRIRKKVQGINLGRLLRQQAFIVLGAFISALGFTLFQVPFNLTAGGVSGLAIVLHHFSGISQGVLFLLLNLPLVVLGFFQLGRWRFLLSVSMALLVFSLGTEYFLATLPRVLAEYPITDNILLSALYAGVSFGVGSGLIFRVGGSFPGTTIIGRILQNRTGYPLSQVYLYTDSAIIISGGLVFGWEVAMLALITLFFAGFAADFVLEGSSQVRSVMVVTENPELLKAALMAGLGKAVTQWEVTGAYSGRHRTMLYCIIHRSQVNDFKYVVAQTDRTAFVVIGVAHQAFGGMSFPMVKNN